MAQGEGNEGNRLPLGGFHVGERVAGPHKAPVETSCAAIDGVRKHPLLAHIQPALSLDYLD